jgi:hypothetical protein
MTRWLWPILAAFSIALSFSAMIFDRVDHSNPHKKEWTAVGVTIPLSNTLDFYPWAAPLTAGSLLACSFFIWLHANAKWNVKRWPLRIPPVGPAAGATKFEKRLDTVVRLSVAIVALGFGAYAGIHIFRHLLKHRVFNHTTKEIFHGPGLSQHLSHWSLSGDLRYGQPEGITYYAGFQTGVTLAVLVAGVIFTVLACWRVCIPRSRASQ